MVVTFILYKVPRAAIALKEINCVADLKRQHYCQVPSGKGHFCYSKLFEFNVLTTEDNGTQVFSLKGAEQQKHDKTN